MPPHDPFKSLGLVVVHLKKFHYKNLIHTLFFWNTFTVIGTPIQFNDPSPVEFFSTGHFSAVETTKLPEVSLTI